MCCSDLTNYYIPIKQKEILKLFMSKLSFNSKYSTKNLNLIQNHQCLQMLIDQVSCIQKQDFYLKILNCLRNLRLILKISTYFGRRIEQRRL